MDKVEKEMQFFLITVRETTAENTMESKNQYNRDILDHVKAELQARIKEIERFVFLCIQFWMDGPPQLCTVVISTGFYVTMVL